MTGAKEWAPSDDLKPVFGPAMLGSHGTAVGPRWAAVPPQRLGLTLGALACLLSGCGASASSAMHRGLTDATDLVDPGYAQAVVECDLQEREVIASHQPDEGDAAAVALARVRARCDVAFASFEELRGLQLALRATADALEDGEATVSDVVRSLDELAAAVETSRALVEAIRAARGAQ